MYTEVNRKHRASRGMGRDRKLVLKETLRKKRKLLFPLISNILNYSIDSRRDSTRRDAPATSRPKRQRRRWRGRVTTISVRLPMFQSYCSGRYMDLGFANSITESWIGGAFVGRFTCGGGDGGEATEVSEPRDTRLRPRSPTFCGDVAPSRGAFLRFSLFS